MHVARATGQPVHAVAAESFALTLWTWATLQAMQREETVERLGERTDMAGLVAVAFHEPAKLQQAEWRYLRAAGRLEATITTARQRAEAMLERLRTARVASTAESAEE